MVVPDGNYRQAQAFANGSLGQGQFGQGRFWQNLCFPQPFSQLVHFFEVRGGAVLGELFTWIARGQQPPSNKHDISNAHNRDDSTCRGKRQHIQRAITHIPERIADQDIRRREVGCHTTEQSPKGKRHEQP